jgi:WD40 repeat protein
VVLAGGKARKVFLWDVGTGQGLGTFPPLAEEVSTLAVAPSGKELALATPTDLQLLTFQPPSGLRSRVRLLSGRYVVSAVAFSADGKRLAACTYDPTVHVWDLATLEQKSARGPWQQPNAIALNGDGSQAVYGIHAGSLFRWAPYAEGAPNVLSQAERCITSAVYVPGSETVIFAGEWDGPLRLRDMTTQRTTRVSTSFKGVVHGLGVSPDGKLLAAACSDGSVRLWDVLADRSAPE